MEKKIVSGIVLALLFISMLTLTFNVQSVKSDWTWTETIYIRADGSVDPPTAPISSADNITYTLTDNIVGIIPWHIPAIVVERDNIVVDGAGYTLQHVGIFLITGPGIYLHERSNVTVKNMKIKAFEFGIFLNSSSYNTIYGNTISASYPHGIHLLSSSNNKFYHNNLLDNNQQVYIGTSGYANVWDDGYPSGGNFWSDYEERYPSAEEIDESGIWDTPYVIDGDNQDNYPLMSPLGDVEPPVADAGPDQIVGEGMPVTFDGSKSTDDMAIKSYVWTFTDTTPQTLTGVKPKYTFENVGDFEVTLNVSDYVGNWDTDTVTINVLPLLHIYIRADGSVDPDTAPITSVDNITYTLTDDIYGNIVVERDNIVVDGAGYTLKGAENGTGIDLTGRSNVTIKNMEIKAFDNGIYISTSSNNTISGNNVTNNDIGIVLNSSSSDNTISGNDITNNDMGIILEYSSDNTISGNDITENSGGVGIGIGWGSSNNIYANHITEKWNGIMLIDASSNNIYGNDITQNSEHGIWLDVGSSNNNIYRNNITENHKHGIMLNVTSSNNNISRNNIIGNFLDGILIDDWSSYNTIFRNNITDNDVGIQLLNSSDNTISENHITANDCDGIFLNDSPDNIISGNDITGNTQAGISLGESSGNTISGNHITENNNYGIFLLEASNNDFFHNNFINTKQVYDLGWEGIPGGPSPSTNTWDDGYPSGGNFWSDYTGSDGDGDGIGDTQYKINATESNDKDRYPLMNPVMYDVAVTNVVPQRTVVGQGYTLMVNVTVLNQGNFTQTFDITLYANTTSIASQEITLTSGNSATVTFTWNTTGVPYGNYTISAKATRVPGETDTTDNTFIDGTVHVKVPGDVNGDGIVDVADLSRLGKAYRSTPSSPNWDEDCDINGDDVVDVTDLSIIGKNYRRSI